MKEWRKGGREDFENHKKDEENEDRKRGRFAQEYEEVLNSLELLDTNEINDNSNSKYRKTMIIT